MQQGGGHADRAAVIADGLNCADPVRCKLMIAPRLAYRDLKCGLTASKLGFLMLPFAAASAFANSPIVSLRCM
jgi:hypothetical protein